MTNNTFNIGDTVRLKSGGPLMTVSDIDGGGQKIWTVWFNEADEEKKGYYPMGAVDHDDGMPTIA